MIRVAFRFLFLVVPCLLGGCSWYSVGSEWEARVDTEVKALGYRNWIVIGDSAFPVHARRGIRTLIIDDEIPQVLTGVLNSLEGVQNVTPRMYVSRELRHIPNDRAPGMDQYRRYLESAMRGYPTREMESRSLSLLLEDSSKTFSVLVLKTKTALPYSSVFIELDSGYWDAESERVLRESMATELKN